jgi:D-alanyl-lipoteichoic acid acyltransferase DltB (MBOAT superfamily)
MSLNETPYLVFLAVAVLLVRVSGAVGRAWLGVLALLSLAFYASWNPWYCAPLLLTAAVDYSVGEALGRTTRQGLRRILVTTSLVFDLGLLAVFKYGTLVTSTLGAAAPLRIVFAAGISFYTFQSLGYVIDVYRGDQKPVGSLARYVAFVSFFPTLLAGPITRAETLVPQLERGPAPLLPEHVGRGLFLIALGFVKKDLIADWLAVNLVNRVFDLPGLYSSAEVLAGIYAYAVQIYCDFSGYSDIAIGSALLLGFSLKENFNAPYRSQDLTEFWRRWHISFSTWLRDYLFFSLPGKRPGTVFPYLNLVLTFTLGGLWHGASWTFAIWGLMHGVGLAFLRFVTPSGRGRKPKPAWRAALGGLATFHFVAASWVFFRVPSVSQALDVFRVLLDRRPGLVNVPPAAVLAILVVLVAQALPEDWFRKAESRFVALPSLAQAVLVLATAAAVRAAAGSAVAPFIYFAF